MDDFQDSLYKTAFEEELRFLERRRASDPSCSVEDFEGTLANLYHMEGANLGGRGATQDTALSASIAAFERVIAEWKGAGRE